MADPGLSVVVVTVWLVTKGDNDHDDHDGGSGSTQLAGRAHFHPRDGTYELTGKAIGEGSLSLDLPFPVTTVSARLLD